MNYTMLMDKCSTQNGLIFYKYLWQSEDTFSKYSFDIIQFIIIKYSEY